MTSIDFDIINSELLNHEPIQAWIWFLIPLAAAIVGVIIYIWVNDGDSEPIQVGSICVLGQKEAGKTTFLNWLRYGKFVSSYTQTIEKSYPEFVYERNKDKRFKIKGGNDIGGAQGYVSDYERYINNSDVCIFVFDVAKFLSDASYRQETWDRADFIYRKCPETKKRHTIGTHFDKTNYKNVNDAANKVIELSDKKQCKGMFTKNFTVVDFNKTESFKDCEKRIFGD